LRWLWHNWDIKEKPWNHLLKVFDKVDRHLFFSSTIVQVGDAKNTPVWESRRINGISPKDLAPNLYHIARFKKRTVAQELYNSN
jgi:hypothetical protein